MSNLESVFKNGHKVLIGYITAGYPNTEATPQIAAALAESGCDIIELGIPFSDPLADGATIQKASYEALQKGVTPAVCLEIAYKIRHSVSVPLAFMTYYNPVLNYGLEAFCRASRDAGISVLIIPDLPPEESIELEPLTRRYGLDLIYFLAPTSTAVRINEVAKRAIGFIYLVSLSGVTGARKNLPPELEDFVKKVRKQSGQTPLCVGFGISTPEQANRVAAVADGVIVGSRIIQLVDKYPELKSLRTFIVSLREALDSCENYRKAKSPTVK
jgi:tryptophan synthase alpha chain